MTPPFPALLRAAVAGVALVALAAAGQRPDTQRGELAGPEIVQVEAAMETMSDEQGIAAAFWGYAGREAIMFLPTPTVINTRMQGVTWAGDLDWRPTFVTAASSGDLAASVGPSQLTNPSGTVESNTYLTVWRREAAGWRFIINSGVRSPENLYAAPAQAPEVVVARGRPGAGFDLRGLEGDLARDAARDARRALSGRLENTARVLRDGQATAVGRDAGAALIAADPTSITYTMRDGSVANAGDLAYAYGEARWTDASGSGAVGDWVRVWRRDGARWRIAIDFLKRRAA